MKKSSTRVLTLSCLTAVALCGGATAHAQTASQTETQDQIQQQYMQNMTAVSTSNAAAAYTGNPALMQQAAQPGQVMMPPGMQSYNQPMVMGPNGQMIPAYNIPGQPPAAERPVVMRYNKKDVEGFYGVALPQRLFNNVPSDW